MTPNAVPTEKAAWCPGTEQGHAAHVAELRRQSEEEEERLSAEYAELIDCHASVLSYQDCRMLSSRGPLNIVPG